MENVRACRHCGAQLGNAGAQFCEICRQSQDPQAQPDLSRLPKCPVCKVPVYPAKINSHDIYRCEECEGTAVPKAVMMKLQPLEPKKTVKGPLSGQHVTPPYFEPRKKPPFLICPFCGKKMKEAKAGPMSVDECEKCASVWLDCGKEKHLNEILGPYKRKRLSEGGGSRFSR